MVVTLTAPESNPTDAVPPPIVVHALTKRARGDAQAVDGLHLRVEQGQVMGLATPKGAGSSVISRIVLGLVRPDSGHVEIFGERVRPGAKVLGRVGALVDGPGFVPHLSGLVNLRLAWRMSGRSETEADLERAVEIAALSEAIERPYKSYSHGMRYRLGLAQALLGRPDLLVLGEPMTGLDTTHAIEIRNAIEVASGHGATVLFSSRQLSHVQRICSHAAVVRDGRLLMSGPVGELVGDHGSLDNAYLAAVADGTPRDGSDSGAA